MYLVIIVTFICGFYVGKLDSAYGKSVGERLGKSLHSTFNDRGGDPR